MNNIITSLCRNIYLNNISIIDLESITLHYLRISETRFFFVFKSINSKYIRIRRTLSLDDMDCFPIFEEYYEGENGEKHINKLKNLKLFPNSINEMKYDILKNNEINNLFVNIINKYNPELYERLKLMS